MENLSDSYQKQFRIKMPNRLEVVLEIAAQHYKDNTDKRREWLHDHRRYDLVRDCAKNVPDLLPGFIHRRLAMNIA